MFYLWANGRSDYFNDYYRVINNYVLKNISVMGKDIIYNKRK